MVSLRVRGAWPACLTQRFKTRTNVHTSRWQYSSILRSIRNRKRIWFFWIFFSISSSTTSTLNKWYLGSFHRFHWNSPSTFEIVQSSLSPVALAAFQQLVWVHLLFTKLTQHWFPYCSLFSCICCQDGGWQSRTRHARQTVRAPRFPCRRSTLDEATGFLSEAQANKQPLGPFRTCECLQGALMKQSFIIFTDWYWWGAARLSGSRCSNTAPGLLVWVPTCF